VKMDNIKIKNYRQLKDIDFDFNNDMERNLHLFIAENGAGKSNFMNAINWCLYNDEPLLDKDSEELPILNLETIENESSPYEVSVEIDVKNKSGGTVRFSRCEKYKNNSESGDLDLLEKDFKVMIINEKEMNPKFLKGDEAEKYVNKFVPKRIREFFFFDGERLREYFVESKSRKLSKNTFEISQIDVIEDVESHLKKIGKDLSKEAGKEYPDIEKIRSKIDDNDIKTDETTNNLEACQKQLEISKKKINELNSYLDNVPNIDKEREKINEWQDEKENKEVQLNEKMIDKKDLLFNYNQIINSFSAFKNALKVIKNKRNNNEIPQNISLDLLNDSLSDNECQLCKQPLDEDAKNQIEFEKSRKQVSSESANILTSIEPMIKTMINNINDFNKENRKINRDIKNLEEDIDRLKDKIKKKDKLIRGFDNEEEITYKFDELDRHKAIQEQNIGKEAVFMNKLEELKEKEEILNEKLKNAMEKKDNLKEINKKHNFIGEAKKIILEVKETIMKKVKNEMELETNNKFFDFIWKDHTFDKIEIDDSYNLKFIHKGSGRKFFQSASSGEKLLLTIAFTLALHSVSGFHAPILIDNPVMRLAGDNRENIMRVLSEVSKDKQIILMLITNEYSDEVKKVVNSIECQQYKIKLDDEEKASNFTEVV